MNGTDDGAARTRVHMLVEVHLQAELRQVFRSDFALELHYVVVDDDSAGSDEDGMDVGRGSVAGTIGTASTCDAAQEPGSLCLDADHGQIRRHGDVSLAGKEEAVWRAVAARQYGWDRRAAAAAAAAARMRHWLTFDHSVEMVGFLALSVPVPVFLSDPCSSKVARLLCFQRAYKFFIRTGIIL